MLLAITGAVLVMTGLNVFPVFLRSGSLSAGLLSSSFCRSVPLHPNLHNHTPWVFAGQCLYIQIYTKSLATTNCSLSAKSRCLPKRSRLKWAGMNRWFWRGNRNRVRTSCLWAAPGTQFSSSSRSLARGRPLAWRAWFAFCRYWRHHVTRRVL